MTMLKAAKTCGAPIRECLYLVQPGIYIQYGGRGVIPNEIRDFIETHDGDLPPHMPLPVGPVEFDLRARGKRLSWSGKGPLPEQVVKYVRENGVLPRNTFDYVHEEEGP